MKSVVLVCLLFSGLQSCSPKVTPGGLVNEKRDLGIDYGDLNSWAAHPYKRDPSDSVPAPLRQHYKADSSIDIFFIHPTTFLNRDLLQTKGDTTLSATLWNADVANSLINDKTDNSSILYQASIFNVAGRLFAPRYRQANYYAYFSDDTIATRTAFDLAYRDIEAAFTYYMKHYNDGRPVVIAAHSQGSTHAKRLLRSYFDNNDTLRSKLVVAYLAGMPVEENFFSRLQPCKSPEQINCFCSWRTLQEGYLTPFVKKENFKAVVTNPLSWDTSSAFVSRNKNQGAVLFNFNKIIKKTTGARIYNNVLWVNKPRFFGSFLSRQKNYHVGDLNLFYINIRENLVQRISAYKKLDKKNELVPFDKAKSL